MWRALGVLAILLGACMADSGDDTLVRPPDMTPVANGCGKDTDCKGSRICVKGQCTDPMNPPDFLILFDFSTAPPDLACSGEGGCGDGGM
jgi:hypothetical protein